MCGVREAAGKGSCVATFLLLCIAEPGDKKPNYTLHRAYLVTILFDLILAVSIHFDLKSQHSKY